MCHLYLTGSYIRNFGDRTKKYRKYIGLFLSAAILAAAGVLSGIIPSFLHNYIWQYSSIVTLTGSAALFEIFLSFDIRTSGLSNIAVRFSGFTFGVYLIHDNPFIRRILWNDWIPRLFSMGQPGSGCVFYQVISAVILVTCECIVLEEIRRILFRILRIDRCINLLSDVLQKTLYMKLSIAKPDFWGNIQNIFWIFTI